MATTVLTLLAASGYNFAGNVAWSPSGNPVPGSGTLVNPDVDFIDHGALFEDGLILSPTFTINSVTFNITHSWSGTPDDGTGHVVTGGTIGLTDGVGGYTVTSGWSWDQGWAPSLSAAWTYTAATNPVTGLAWTKTELFSYLFGWNMTTTSAWSPFGGSYAVTTFTATVDYDEIYRFWYYNPLTKRYAYLSADPGTPWIRQDPSLTGTTGVTLGGNHTRHSTQLADDSWATFSIEDDTYTVDLLTDFEFDEADDIESELEREIFPSGGCAGTLVAIEGTGFGNGATVKFDGVSATNVTVINQYILTCVTPAHADGLVDITVTNADNVTTTLEDGFEYVTPWWERNIIVVFDAGTTHAEVWVFQDYVNQCDPPDDYTFVGIGIPDIEWFELNDLLVHQRLPPGINWRQVPPPDPNGWYLSTVDFQGSIQVVAGGSPHNPRTWSQLAIYAAGNAGMLGGSPAASCTFENRLVFPGSDYTTSPNIHIFDGSFDHVLCSLPTSVNSYTPYAVMSLLAANGTIYVSCVDRVGSSAVQQGRVFSLDVRSGVLAQIGDTFLTSVPYALAWHMGRLWAGTNNADGTASGVYFFRPDIDTTWTLDEAMTGGVDSMLSFKGNLYVGTDEAAGTFAKVLVRDSNGTYTTSQTAAPGGVARVNNGYLNMVEFDGNLYASYWNQDTTAASLIQKFDGTAWSTVYTGSSTTNRPFIILFEDQGSLLAFAGGLGLTGAVIITDDGTTWTNLTAQLPESNKTLLPMVGVELL